MAKREYYIQVNYGSINDFRADLKSYKEGDDFDKLNKFKYVSKDNLKSAIKELSKGKNISQVINYTMEAKI